MTPIGKVATSLMTMPEPSDGPLLVTVTVWVRFCTPALAPATTLGSGTPAFSTRMSISRVTEVASETELSPESVSLPPEPVTVAVSEITSVPAAAEGPAVSVTVRVAFAPSARSSVQVPAGSFAGR